MVLFFIFSNMELYQSAITLNHFEGLKLTLASLKISHLEQLNSKIFASLSTSFSCLKIDHLVKRTGIKLQLLIWIAAFQESVG